MRYIAALDVGTSSVRCFIIDERCEVKGKAQELVQLLSPQPGYFEIEPESLWRQIVQVVTSAVKDARIVPANLKCLTLCTQRCTFLTWNHKTNEYYHNFITWKDLRSDELVNSWNASFTIKSLNTFAHVLYFLTRLKRFQAASCIKMMNGQVTLRWLYELQNNKKLNEAIARKEARLELLDSWILYKLRSGNGLNPHVPHITDITSATATGLFDPFTLNWSPLLELIFKLDTRLLPKPVDNDYINFGCVQSHIFGPDWADIHLPIACSASDQTAAMWGSHCFREGDVKLTMGTGAFLNLITGAQCPASMVGMYPLVAWRLDQIKPSLADVEHLTFCMEGAAHDMGTIIAWAQTCGLFTNVNETSQLAASVPHTNGVYFVPAFSGLGPPINDHKAASGFIGITPTTTRAHLVRAILESITYRLVQLCESAQRETDYTLKLLRVDGGVSRNDFVCQFLADATGVRVERAENAESSVLGVAYMGGIVAGIWKDLQAIKSFRKVERVFEPRRELYDDIRQRMEVWHKAVERFGNWY